MERFDKSAAAAALVLSLVAAFALDRSTASAAQVSYDGLKCHPSLTINVSGTVTKNVLHAVGYLFSEGYYRRVNYTHYSVCICKVANCLHKCCKQGQALYNKSCVDGHDYDIRPNVYSSDLQLLYNYDYSRFVPVHGNSCEHGWFTMDPADPYDEYFFMEDGTLYLPNQLRSNVYAVEDYCFEHLLRYPGQKPGPAVLRPMGCFPAPVGDSVSTLLPIGMIISTPFLLATFLVYALPELRNLHGKNLMSHVGSLFVAYITLVVVQMASPELPQDVCIAFGYTIQYSFLASFFWLNVMCFDIWWAFSAFSRFKGDKRSAELKKYLWYSLYGWGCPAVISAVTLIMEFAPNVPDSLLRPDIGVHRCFFTDEKVKLAYFYGPTAVILLCDVVLFVFTALKILMVKQETVAVFSGKDSTKNHEASKQRFVLYLKLFLIMGVNWIMEVISWAAEGPRWVWYFTDFANTLQGVLIFTLFVLAAKTKKVISNRLSSQTLKSYVTRDSSRQSSGAQS